MTPEERQLITGLFDRMRTYGAPEKDREAEAIIGEAVRRMPDAPYMLVQSVLVQEHALQEAGNRIRDLEEQVRGLQQRAGQAQAPGSGSFLGGLLGGGRPVSQPGAGSVPPIGSRAAPSAAEQDQQRPWSQSPQQPQAGAPAGGGFLRSAMATAAGVAGGMLAAGAIRDLLGGGSAHAQSNPNPNAPAAGGADTTSAEQARQDWEQDVVQDAADDDPSWGDDGGDLDI
ncbi:MAG: DUF2076 domain-containing protein [Hyphomonadaceae bacterium]|nr:DUF2076 domain-containing protein [Hyphomonadaceae bacterium]